MLSNVDVAAEADCVFVVSFSAYRGAGIPEPAETASTSSSVTFRTLSSVSAPVSVTGHGLRDQSQARHDGVCVCACLCMSVCTASGGGGVCSRCGMNEQGERGAA